MGTATIKFKYIFDEDYEPKYVNGAVGGINPDGGLVVNFYMDRLPIPYETEQSINEDGTLDTEIVVTKPAEMKVRRVIKNGIVMNKETAVSIYKWFREQLEEMGVSDDDL